MINTSIKFINPIEIKFTNPLTNSIKQIQENSTLLVQQFKEQQKAMAKQFMEAITLQVDTIAARAKEWQIEQGLKVSSMAEVGWFPNWYTFNYHLDFTSENIDDFMCNHIDENFDEITDKILRLCKNRSIILRIAFDLHKQGNYIASIPLLLNQSDGICSEEFTHFFTKDNRTGRRASEEIIRQAEGGEIHINFLTKLLLEPFKIKTQLSQRSSKSSKLAKSKGPNRHGIIHGNRKHLDYGTRLNGYKTFSFLAFIVFTTKDAFKK